MTRRIPFWLALLPLALGLAAYWLYWKSEAEDFRERVARVVPNAGAVEIGGFPYRIEARLPAASVLWERADSFVSLSADRTVVNRQPWRTGHVVIAAENAKLLVTLPEIAGARLDIETPAALASMRRPGGTLERLSMRFETAKVWLPLAGGPFDAQAFELHLRETPTGAKPTTSPTYPAQAEARVAGILAHPDGATFKIEAPLFATAARRIASVAGWRAGGTVEIKAGRLLAANDAAVAGFDATLAPLPDGRLAIVGTIDTDCPATVRALLDGRVPATEFRARRAQRLPISGVSGGDIVLGEPVGPKGGPVRSQEPPCPALRR